MDSLSILLVHQILKLAYYDQWKETSENISTYNKKMFICSVTHFVMLNRDFLNDNDAISGSHVIFDRVIDLSP